MPHSTQVSEGARQSASATLFARIRAVDPTLLQEFGHYYDDQLQQAKAEAARQGLADPYQVQAQLIAQLLDGAYGREGDGRCFVPEPGLESPGWRIRVAPNIDLLAPQGGRGPRGVLGGASSARGLTGLFQTLGRGEARRGVGIVVLGSLLLLGPLVLYLTWPRAAPTRARVGGAKPAAATAAVAGAHPEAAPSAGPTFPAAPPTIAPAGNGSWLPSVGGVAVKAAAIAPASLEFSDGIFRVEASRVGTDGSWQPRIEPGHAAWLEGTIANLVVCVGPDAAPVIGRTHRGTLLLIRSRSGSLRRYQVDAVTTVPQQETAPLAQTRSGLTVILCGVGTAERQLLRASYRPDPASSVAAGQPVALGNRAIFTVEDARVVTATVPLPPGQIEVAVAVAVTNLQPAPLALDGLVDELQLDGQLAELADDGLRPTLAPAGQPASAGRVIYRYRTVQPDVHSAGPAVWQLAGSGGERIAVNLHVAPSVPAVMPQLQVTLTAAHLMAAPGGTAQLLVTIHVANPGTTPAPVDWSAVRVWDGKTGARLAPANRTAQPDHLAPGATTDQIVTVAAPQGPMALLDLGAANGGARWHLTLHP